MNRAAGSNLQMVRSSLMSVVKLLITDTKVHVHYVFAHVLNLKFLRVREIDCVWTEMKGLLLDCSVGAKENRSEGS